MIRFRFEFDPLAFRLLDPEEVDAVLAESWLTMIGELSGSGTAPGTNWPIGTLRAGSRTSYVEPGTPGSRESGRSLQGWRPRFSRNRVEIVNDVPYAPFTRLRGEHEGAAMTRAVELAELISVEAGETLLDLMSRRFIEGPGGGLTDG